jgi:hypothetical protein
MVLKLGVHLSAEQLRKSFEEIDSDGGGTLGFEEFETFLEKGAQGGHDGGGGGAFAGLADALRKEVKNAKNALEMASKISESGRYFGGM